MCEAPFLRPNVFVLGESLINVERSQAYFVLLDVEKDKGVWRSEDEDRVVAR
jgi:hypothetical protein